VVFFLVPFLLVLKISFADSDSTIPPYTPLFTLGDDSVLQISLHLDNFIRLFSDDPIYLLSYLSSLRNAAVTTLFCLLIGYPMAYAIARATADASAGAADADRAAVLDLVPDPHLCLDRHPQGQWAAE
jgi:putrescine transport system permease protein